MADLSFLTNNRSRRALEAVGITTLEQALEAGKGAVLRVKYVADATWAEIVARSEGVADIESPPTEGSLAVLEKAGFIKLDQPSEDGGSDMGPIARAVNSAIDQGTNSDAAVAAVEELLELQALYGFCRLGGGVRRPSDWSGAMACLLQLYRDAKPPSVLFKRLGEWWNQAVELNLDPDVTLWINQGVKAKEPSPAAQIFYAMSEVPDIPLPRPAKPYPVAG